MATAVLVDAAYFLKRIRHVYPDVNSRNPERVVRTLYAMCMDHVQDRDLYRILVYDCPPLAQKSQHPITGEDVDFSRLPGALFRSEFHGRLKRLRKVALRLGYLQGHQWIIKPQPTKQLHRAEGR